MKAIRLYPVRRTAPVCDSFGDLGSVRKYEREMRVHRAFVEPYLISPLDDRVDGAYRISGAAGASYTVDIVDASGRHDTCSCPDFLSSWIGTCKHLEAVRRMFATSRGVRTMSKRLPPEPRLPTLTVVPADGRTELRTIGRWTQALVQDLGLESAGPAGAVEPRDGMSLTAGWHDTGVRIVHAAPLAAHRMRTRQSIRKRNQDVRSAFVNGRISVDLLSRPLFPYQHDGVLHLVSGGRALLADDMGLGKTVQAIAACEALRARGEASRIIVVTPASLKEQWAREIKRYANQEAVVVGGGAHLRRAAFESDVPYKVLNYELTWRELSILRTFDADVLILDEAQRAKNFRTKTAATLRAIPSRFLFVLTGTPIENRLDDLYSLLQLIDPDLLGPLWKFNHDFHDQNEKGRVVGYKNLSGLRERIQPVVLRRRKEEVLTQLPPLVEQTRYTALTDAQAELEEGYRNEALKLLSIAERRPLTPDEQKILQAKLLKARQACDALELCDPKRGKASPKLDEFEAVISEIVSQGTSKVLVFSEWVHMLNLAADRLDRQSIRYSILSGDVPTNKRQALLDRFRDDPDLRVLLSTDAGGVGLNLQVANYVVHLDLPWNPGRLDQRTSRAHRLGQTRGVFVTYLCATEGIERGIEGTLAGKRAIRSAALDPSSTAEELEAPSFSVFLRQLREVLDQMAEPGRDVEIVAGEEVEAGGTVEAREVSATVPGSEGLAEAHPTRSALAAEPSRVAATETAARPRASNRLRLAKVVLDAGFAGDAVRAAYEALAAAIAGLLPDGPPPASHAALVAAIYRDLFPAGRIAPAAPAALARLHDLTTLESQGVEVDTALAKAAVAEAEEWVGRLHAPVL